ncbi:MAG: hypothetical protein R2991_04050 [Thermoanaerobaculia bacterium]
MDPSPRVAEAWVEIMRTVTVASPIGFPERLVWVRNSRLDACPLASAGLSSIINTRCSWFAAEAR